MPERPPVPADPADRFRIKRIYRAARVPDGKRMLVDRLWPRGVAKDLARLFCWCSDIAPSDALLAPRVPCRSRRMARLPRLLSGRTRAVWRSRAVHRRISDARHGARDARTDRGRTDRGRGDGAQPGDRPALRGQPDPGGDRPDLLRAQIDRCLGLGIGAFSFFWDVVPEAVARAKASGCPVLHQVGTLRAAREAEAAGADVLIAQGIEAGGHGHGCSGAFALAADLLRQTHPPVVVVAGAEDTVLTDIFVLNWPKGAAVRVIANDVTAALGGRYLGHDPADLPRQANVWDDGAPRLRCSTDSPLRTTTGDLEAMALYAGQGVGGIDAVVPAGERLSEMAREAAELLAGRAPGRTDEGKKS